MIKRAQDLQPGDVLASGLRVVAVGKVTRSSGPKVISVDYEASTTGATDFRSVTGWLQPYDSVEVESNDG